MRILLICHEYPPLGGGAATVAWNLARAFAEEHAVTVLTSGYRGLPGMEVEGRVRVVRAHTLRRAVYGASPLEMLAFTLSALATGVALARRERFAGCLAVQGIPAAWVALPLARWFGFPYVVSLVGADVPGFLPERYDRLHRLVGWATARTWRGAAGVIANSESLRALAEQTARPIGVRVDAVPFGVDAEMHRPEPLAAKPRELRLLFVGRLSVQKGARYLLEAVAQIREELRGRARVEIVGDGEERDEIVKRAERAGVTDIVSFTPWLSREDLALRYRAAHAFVLPSLDEGRSQAVLEAMASGLAVVASAIDGNAGLVREGVNGFTVPPRDAIALAAALIRLVRLGPDRVAAMGEVSRSIVLEFGWARTAEAYVAYFSADRVGASR